MPEDRNDENADTLAATDTEEPAREAPPDLHPRDSARYRFEKVIGQGGMGRVVRAYDEHLNRAVAIKELLASDRANAERRFRHEALVTAGLQHHGVVPVHDAGRWSTGAAFYAMKLVSGRPLDEILADADGLSGRLARLPELIDVAETMAYAHSEGVIHRDLKPANVMVGDYGETLVVDWGLAKRLRGATESEAESAGSAPSTQDADAELTRVGDVMGTLLYMPPEQARGKPVDERADVYALGAMLYQLLTGFAPYRDHSGPDQRITRHTILGGPPTPVRKAEPDAPVELVAIVDKAMAREPEDRYASAGEVADELKRFQAGQLVGAHRYTFKQLIARWVRRHRVPLAVAGVAAAVLVAVGVVSIVRIVRAERTAVAERDRATEAERVAVLERNRLRIQQARAALDRDPTAALAWLVLDDEVTGEMLEQVHAIGTDALARGVASRVMLLPGPAVGLAAAPDADVFAAATADGHIRVWNTDGALLLDHDLGAAPIALAISNEGGAVMAATAEGHVAWWLDERRRLQEIDVPGGIQAARLSRNGRRLFAVSPDRVARAFDATRPDEPLQQWNLKPKVASAAALSPSGRFAAVGHPSGSVSLRDLEGDAVTQSWVTTAAIVDMAFEPNDELVTLTADGAVTRWSEPGRPAAPPIALGGESQGPLWIWDGGGAAGLMPPGRVAVWSGGDVVSRELPFAVVAAARWTGPDWTVLASGPDVRVFAASYELTLRGHADSVLVGRTASAIVSASADASVRVWRLPAHPSARADVPAVWTAPTPLGDGAWLAGTEAGDVWRIETDGAARKRRELGSQVVQLATAARGRLTAAATIEGLVAVFDGDELRVERTAAAPNQLRLTDSAVAVLGYPGNLSAWSLPAGDELVAGTSVNGSGLLELTGDDRVFAQNARAELVVYDPAERVIGSVDEPVTASALLGDATVLVGTATGSLIHIAADGRVLDRTSAHDGTAWDIAVAGTGTAATAGGDGVVRVWAVDDSGRLSPVQTLRGHDRWAHGVAFSPDGRHLASWSEGEPRIRVWSAADGGSRVLPLPGRARGAAFSEDGATLAASDYDRGVFVFDDWDTAPPPASAKAARAWIRGLTSAAVSGTARLESPAP